MPSITDSIGRVLGDRYRLVTALGTGASAHVYLADDVSLHRRVAIKVLHPALAGDARLPQAVPGRGPGGGRPQPSQHPPGLRLGRGGRRALPGARVPGRRQPPPGLRHRRPAHARTGGPDRARRPPPGSTTPTAAGWSTATSSRPTCSSTPTDDSGSPTSVWPGRWPRRRGPSRTGPSWARPATPPPSRSRGWVLDGKADVYALALVLYEGVTGETPFIGDTTIATLMARVGALLPEHDGPRARSTTSWCGRPPPSRPSGSTPPSSRSGWRSWPPPCPTPLPIAHRSTPSRSTRPRAWTGRWSVPPGGRPSAAARPTPPSSGSSPGSAPLDAAGEAVGQGGEAAPRRAAASDRPAGALRARRRWPWITAIVGGGRGPGRRRRGPGRPGQAVHPQPPGPRPGGQVGAPGPTRPCKADQFTVRTTGHASSITVGAGPDREPAARAPVRRPAGHGQGGLDHRRGRLDRAARRWPSRPLDLVHLLRRRRGRAEGRPPGRGVPARRRPVQLDGGGRRRPGQRRRPGPPPTARRSPSVISKGHAPVAIPTVTGSGTTYTSAAAALDRGRLRALAEQRTTARRCPTGQVIGTAPAATAGPQPFGSTVTVDISLGPQPVIIPNVVGQSVAAATSALDRPGPQGGRPLRARRGPPRCCRRTRRPGPRSSAGTTVNLYTL